jgi:hypothetical protein
MRGGIVTAWDERCLTLTSFTTRHHTLITTFTSTAFDFTFTVTNVYAPADHKDSQTFLEDLSEVVEQISGNWLLVGDFNLTRGREDNSTGNACAALCDAFNSCIHDLSLLEILLLDRLFTWSNHRSAPTLAWIDRVFFNVPMSLAFPNSTLTSLPKPTSDHTPLHLLITTSIPKSNVFCFENIWLKSMDFLSSVLPSWHGLETHP